MAPFPKKSIDDHFIHPGHTLAAVDKEQDYLCDGCKTTGTGKRYRCQDGCDFDMHEYCRTCPMKFPSFMHPHELSLVMRRGQSQRQHHRICDVCSESVEGLFYRCSQCEFDVHPLCTQLPRDLNHALDRNHPLKLESWHESRWCAVCKGKCSGWRYRCAACNVDIHLECVLVPVVHPQPSCHEKGETTERRISTPGQGLPFGPRPHFAPYGFPYYRPVAYNVHHGLNMHYGQHTLHPANFMPHYHHPAAVGTTNTHGTANPKPKKSMFSLVGRLGAGVVCNMIFGVDFVSLLAA